MSLFGPYYYGKHKWDNYLLDIQDSIKSGDAANQRGMRDQTKAFGIAHEEQLAVLREQTEQMHHIEDALRGGFEELRAEFEWGFTLIVDRLETQIDQLSQIAARLDAIHKTLQSPLMTQARELFQLGQEHFRKGLLDKALEAYLKAEEKNEVDFPLQLQIGKLYLYGRDEDDDVIDLTKAEKHLLLAARYADAEKATFNQWNEYCGQAYFHAAVAAYLIGEQEQTAERPEAMRACLERALTYLNKAAVLWPRFTEIVYTQAKCHALLGQVKDAEQKLAVLSDRDRRYFAKARQDGDFETFQSDFAEVFRKATVDPGPLARAVREKVVEVIEGVGWAKRANPTSTEDLKAIAAIERDLSRAEKVLPTLEVDIETLNEELELHQQTLEKITQKSFKANIDSSESAVSECESRKKGSEYRIERLKEKMKATSGAAMGWSCAAVTMILIVPMASSIFMAMLLPLVGNNTQSASQTLTPLILFADLGGGILAGIVGSKLWRDHKNQPHRKEYDENTQVIGECVRTIPLLKVRSDGWKDASRSFEEWRTKRSCGPSSTSGDYDTKAASGRP